MTDTLRRRFVAGVLASLSAEIRERLRRGVRLSRQERAELARKLSIEEVVEHAIEEAERKP